MFAEVSILLALLIITIFIQSKKKDSEKIFGIYSQPGKWFYVKYIAFFLILLMRKLKAKLTRKFPAKELEKMKALSNHEKAFDATFFQAVSKNGIYFCGGIERRHLAKANALFYLAVPELGLLESEKLPKTLLNADPASVLLQKEYGAEGINFAMIEPMKKWKISFNGKMRLQKNPDKLLDIKLNGEWTSDLPYFLLETDINLKCLAKAIAREAWTENFFKSLKTAHQIHYEQMGYFTGTLSVENKNYTLKMDAFRDHSFGHKRDWSLLHRYAFHMMYLENGTRISIGVVSQPSTISLLEMGYIVLPNKSIHSIDYCDLLLYQHGENGTPGKNYAFSFHANNETYEAKINVIYESFHYKGNDIEAKLIERFIECEVNGMKGRGVSEWHYNNLEKK